MASAAGNGRRRCQGDGLPAPPSRHEAGGQIRRRPAPIRIRWYRTRALANGTSGRGLSCWTPVVALPKPNEGGRQTVANPRPHLGPALQVVQAAVRQALAELDGPWSARIAPLEAFCVEIAAPDGFRWLAFIPDPRRQGTKAVARCLKDACRQRPSSSRLTRWKKAWIIVTEGLS
jgi:hypothetical protein